MQENSDTREIYLDCFLKIYPWEIKTNNVKRGTNVFVKIQLGNIVLYSRKVSLAGRVKEIYKGEKFTDILLEAKEDVVLLRLWPEKQRLLDVKNIEENSFLKAFGTLREDRDGNIYVSVLALSRIPENHIESFYTSVEEDRRFFERFLKNNNIGVS
ncbi:MAG: hypothetical protein GU357_04255 [Thermofilum sp.]|jgi:hypothetical protein|nr:hypothetical protein [Thermofilum sp.]